MSGMRDFILLCVHVIVTMARLAGPGGLRSVVAESALLRHQLLILNRGRKRAPNLHGTDLSRRYRPESDSAGLFMANYKFAMNTITKRHLSRGIMRTLEGVAKPPKPPYSGRGILKPVLMVAETR